MSTTDHSTRPAQLLALQKAAIQSRGEPTSLAERLAMLRKMEAALMANRLALADAMNADFGGRAREESLLELFVVIDDLRHAQKKLKAWMRPRRVWANWQFWPSRAQLIPQPLGVVGVIGAYNYPVMTALSPVVQALAAGNRVLLKPSDLTPKTAQLIATLMASLFAPAELAVVNGGLELAEAFTALPFDHLVFTGSTRVGKLVAKAAAENLVPITLELGGKSPVLVDASFDLKAAAETIVQSKFLNAGQTCVTGDYVLLPRAAVPAFLQHARAAIQQFYPTLVASKDYGRVLLPRDWQRLKSWVDAAAAAGATVETINPASELCSAENRVFPPTLVSAAPTSTPLMQHEVFGPVLPVMGYDSLDAAIAHINAGERPLALYVFSHDRAMVDQVLSRTLSGGVSVNGIGYHAIQHALPFGGVGASGMGAYRGQWGFDRFSHLKPVLHMSALTKASVFLRPPYGKTASWVLGFMLHNKPKQELL